MSTSETLDYNCLYLLDDPIASRPLRLTVRGYTDWVNSDYASIIFRGQIFPEQPIKFGAYMGEQITDFLWSDLLFMVCISAKVEKILSENGVTGWLTYPVKVYNRKGELLQGYHGFAVTGSECRRDRSRSQILTRQAVPGGKPFQVYRGLYFEEADWDGSDIFIVRRYGGTIVTEKVYNILKQAKVTNVKLIPLSDVERDVYLDKFDHDS